MKAFAVSLFFCASLSSLSSMAADMRIYNFTSSFIDCVKQHAQEEQESSADGTSVSALMNGGKSIPSGQIKNNYWSYMNCLSRTDSGTANISLPVGGGCEDISITSDYGQLYIPPGLDGKTVSIRGYSWTCSGGSWQPQAEPELSNAECDTQVVTNNACRFEFPGSRHGQSVEDWFGPKAGDLSATSEGYARGVCQNGVLQISASTCAPSTCESGELVSWIDLQTGAYCSGNVAGDGTVSSTPPQRLYFPTLDSAQLRANVTTGAATFICTGGHWSQKGGATCAKKTVTQLNCSSLASATGGRKYYCE